MEQYEMVAKTFKGLEDVLAEELRGLGAANVEPGNRMVSFVGDKEMMYKANLQCRTALRILKPFCKFIAADPDELYDRVKEYDWSQLMDVTSTFSIDSTVYSDDFTHSRYVVYRVKDAIVDYFRDRYGDDKRPGVRLQDADVQINIHIAGDRVTLSLDSSGESLHKRGYRVAQTEAPINEVLAAGIILKSGWRGDCPLVDPMCGSGTFLVEAALIAANIMPGVYRQGYAFEKWPDYDAELFDRLYNDDSQEREFEGRIIGCDNNPKAIVIARQNLKSAGVAKYVDLELRELADWTEEDAPEGGVLITNPPYGERLKPENLDELYALIGTKLKHVFKGYHAWIIGINDENFKNIGLTPSAKIPMFNGALDCELREYIIFDGDYRTFRSQGGKIKHGAPADDEDEDRPRRRKSDAEWKRDARSKGMGGRGESRGPRKLRNKEEDGGADGKRPRKFRDPGHRPERKGGSHGKPGEGYKMGGKRFTARKDDDAPRGKGKPAPFKGERRRDEAPLTPEQIKRQRYDNALKTITGKQPSLPPSGDRAPMMRSRRNKKEE